MALLKTLTLSISCLLLGAFSCFGVTNAAAQQSSVALYGVIDLGIQYAQARRDAVSAPFLTQSLNQTFFGMSNGVQSGSRWGLRGVEYLGSGVEIDFVLEAGFNPAQGTLSQGGRLFGRQSTMGISMRDIGRLDIGRQINLASNYFMTIDPFAEGFGQANIGTSFGSTNTARYSNMLLLQTTPLTGLKLGAGYSFSTGITGIYSGDPICLTSLSCSQQGGDYNFVANQNMRALTLGALYSRGPVDLAIAYDVIYGDVSQHDSNTNISAWVLGAAYDFKLIKLSATFGRVMNGLMNGQNSGAGSPSPSGLITASGPASAILFLNGAQASSYMVGLTVPLASQMNLLASWQMMQPQGLLNGITQFKSQQIYSAALTHNFSARTNLYTYVSYAQNYAMVHTAESIVFGVGIRHQF